MELTPRTGPESDASGAPTTRSRRNRAPMMALIVVIIAVGGFVAVKALGSATTFYRNVDEAVAQRDSLGAKRFRIQGTVVPGTVKRTGDGVSFEIGFNGVALPVNHVGDPPEMFKEGQAVLLEGHFASDGSYASDQMIIKHSEVYESKNSKRITDAEKGGSVPITTVETTIP